MKRILAALAAVLIVGGCASITGGVNQGARRSREIADDALAFNDAYGQAVTGQILQNVLRARDRLPRHYLSMTGISDAPSLRLQQSAGIGQVPFGEGSSWSGLGSIGVERETQSQPSYAVQPFDAGTLTRTAFEATKPYVFAHYWESGWPRDLLVLLMVERIEVTDAHGVRHSFVNEANTIFSDCAPAVETDGCAFVRAQRAFQASIEALSPAPAPAPAPAAARGGAICGLVEAYQPTRPVAAAPRGEQCDPVFVVGAERFVFKLRSLDDIIYYVGELMRAGSTNAQPGKPIEAQINVRAAGLRGGGKGVPLFRILTAASAPSGLYAAEILYGGVRYNAGPAIGRSCAQAAQTGACMDDAEHGDRSSSVLSLIAELLALNQSPDAILAPSRLIAH